MTPEPIVLDDDAVTEILRLRDTYETPWEQLALDEGCDPHALREAVQEWEAGQGGVVVASIVRRPPKRPKLPPSEVAQRRRDRQRVYRARRVESMQAELEAQGLPCTRVDAVEALRVKAQRERVEKAQRRQRWRALADELLGGISVWCAAGQQRTEEQREALYRVCAVLRADGATIADVAWATRAPTDRNDPALSAAYRGVQPKKPPMGGGIRGRVLRVLRDIGEARCTTCLAAEPDLAALTWQQVSDAIAGLRRDLVVSAVDLAPKCEHPEHVDKALPRGGKRPGAWRAAP